MGITEILTLLVGILIFIIMILGFAYWYVARKEKLETKDAAEGNKKTKKQGNELSTKSSGNYTKLSVFDFMEFDSIRDNMIIQNNGERYLMVIECEGINYDLMSDVEKNAVEQGFISFLNTLRYPIQLYIQTRTINISSSIENYNKQLEKVRQDLITKQNDYNRALQNGVTDTKSLNKLRMEMARCQNLYDYGKDIIGNTEKMSLNKNVLRKHYYIIIPYYTAELGVNIDDEEEKRNMVFSEIYTRAQTIIRTLFACSMKGKILDSNGLVDLLYVAYNRDEAEVYGMDKAMKAGYTELYSTAPDVLDKKMESLDRLIEQKAEEKAKAVVDRIKTEKEKAIEQKEEDLDVLANEFAKMLIRDNKSYIGEDIANEAIQELDNTKEEVLKNGKKETKSTARRNNK